MYEVRRVVMRRDSADPTTLHWQAVIYGSGRGEVLTRVYTGIPRRWANILAKDLQFCFEPLSNIRQLDLHSN